MIDFDTIRQKNDIRTVIESYLGPHDYGDAWLCPFHDEKTPSFKITPDGSRFKCFGCQASGDVVDFVQQYEQCTLQEALDKLDTGSFALVTPRSRPSGNGHSPEISPQEQIKKILPKIEQYHRAVNPYRYLWNNEGIGDDVIDAKKLGYASKQAFYAGPSLVIPYWGKDGELLTVRHRLLNPNSKGKYRPEIAGLGNHLFNIPSLYNAPFFEAIPDNCAIVVEGEKKALVVESFGFKCVGIPGATSWRPDWGKFFTDAGIEWVFVALDPDTHPDRPVEKEAHRIADDLKDVEIKCRVCKMVEKPDDFLIHTLQNVSMDQRVEIFKKWLKFGRKK